MNFQRNINVLTTTASLLLGALSIASAQYQVKVPLQAGDVTQSCFPADRWPSSRPDFILIQNTHSDINVQFAISAILTQLRGREWLPNRIAVEGAAGPIDTQSIQRIGNAHDRKAIAKFLVSNGEMTGVTHFVTSTGRGQLYGVESLEYYESAVKMFRSSYDARARLSDELNRLEQALLLVKTEPGEATRISILQQDIQVMRRLVDQRVLPTEINQMMNRAVYAVDHLKQLLPSKKDQALLEPVSAAVNFYAFALLRDEGLLKHSLELRKKDRQRTTVLIAGGFHTSGLIRRLKEEGFSYIVITPRTIGTSKNGEKLYVQRLLGNPSSQNLLESPALSFPMERTAHLERKASEVLFLASRLRSQVRRMALTIPTVQDIFTALDQPLEPSVKLSLARQRAEMLSTSSQVALNHN